MQKVSGHSLIFLYTELKKRRQKHKKWANKWTNKSNKVRGLIWERRKADRDKKPKSKKKGVPKMSSVTQRITEIKQPRGGYINPREFEVTQYGDNVTLGAPELIHPILVGLAVDYLTRYMQGDEVEVAFGISIKGAVLLGIQTGCLDTVVKKATYLVDCIAGLTDKSVQAACILCGYDVCLRAGIAGYREIDFKDVDAVTVSNIRVMVERSLAFISKEGPITTSGCTFEGGYTDKVTTGDCDFTTEATLWDMKVSKNKPTNKHTIQLLMYYLMGLEAKKKEFESIKELGIYNPRLNCKYTLNIEKLDPKMVEEVREVVMGYTTKGDSKKGV